LTGASAMGWATAYCRVCNANARSRCGGPSAKGFLALAVPIRSFLAIGGFTLALLATLALAAATGASAAAPPPPPGLPADFIPVDFILFGLTLLGVAVFHHRTLQVALTGLGAIVAYKLALTGFKTGTGLTGLALHMQHEWVILANLFLLLMGFALL